MGFALDKSRLCHLSCSSFARGAERHRSIFYNHFLLLWASLTQLEEQNFSPATLYGHQTSVLMFQSLSHHQLSNLLQTKGTRQFKTHGQIKTPDNLRHIKNNGHMSIFSWKWRYLGLLPIGKSVLWWQGSLPWLESSQITLFLFSGRETSGQREVPWVVKEVHCPRLCLWRFGFAGPLHLSVIPASAGQNRWLGSPSRICST